MVSVVFDNCDEDSGLTLGDVTFAVPSSDSYIATPPPHRQSAFLGVSWCGVLCFLDTKGYALGKPLSWLVRASTLRSLDSALARLNAACSVLPSPLPLSIPFTRTVSLGLASHLAYPFLHFHPCQVNGHRYPLGVVVV